ncbi:Fcf1-domain-containing protein [Pisolithus orientalis]|uniref:Fcf1-domain-containing protein n=1 Tax=Pisolithus orientalis TaxID=936130 RepID=UPI00222423C9|nr:Fcf1-domain-containing protein [Pisolithus orientalis]KAI6002457.1 Fcf1-domain-containing protein [Pisolithus orientalis]
MRQKRAKTYRKLMSLYCMSFGFREPYQILVDSEICRIATESRIDLSKQLSTVLQGATKPMITQCCIHELYLQGKSQQSAVDLAKAFERRKCNHREAIPGDDCLASVVGDSNKHRYVVATQSQPLRAKLHLIPGVPIIHINRSVMILEPPSEETLRVKQQALVDYQFSLQKEQEALGPAAAELVKLPQQPSNPPRKKKGPKGPNPLSMKKKVTRPVSVTIPWKSDSIAPPSPSDLSIGEKRKREENEEQLTATRKRKRRKKHGGRPTSSVVTTA